MKRFFFDVSYKTHVQYDYQGRDFAQPEQARELAELIALDLECSESDTPGSEVQGRNVGGTFRFSVPSRQADSIAA